MSKIIDQNEILKAVRKKIDGGSWHGISYSDYEEFYSLLTSVISNDTTGKTEFPDFISENGFIEHFHVTSGKSTCKGYDITTQKSKMQNNHESFMKNVDDILKKNDDNGVLRSRYHTSFCRKNDSVENFHKSFKNCWENHINHLHNYMGNKHLSCFLVSSDDVLVIHECMKDENNIFFGDLAHRKNIKFCLSYDIDLLNYIYEYNLDVDYVIYYNINWNYVEVLKVTNIPAIKNFLPQHKYELYPLMAVETSSTYGIHIPNDKRT